MKQTTFFRSPIRRWVGSKYDFLQTITSLIPSDTRRLIEPFCGSAVLSFNQYERYVILNDSNWELINFLRILQNQPDHLIDLLNTYRKMHSLDFYNSMRNSFKYTERTHYCDWDLVRASRFIYLHYTCFNGLYRVNKANYFNVPIGKDGKGMVLGFDFDREQLIEAHCRLTHMYLESMDYREVVKPSRNYFSPQRKDLVVLDPPYMGTFSSYSASGFKLSDHIDLCTMIKELDRKGVYFMLFNSDNILYREYLNGFTVKQLNRKGVINSDGNNREKVRELLFTNTV